MNRTRDAVRLTGTVREDAEGRTMQASKTKFTLAVVLLGALAASLGVLQLLDASRLRAPIVWAVEGGIVILAATLVRLDIEWRQQAASLRSLTDAVPALIAYVNAEERLVFHNRAYYKRFGQTGPSAIGRTLREILGELLYRRVRKHVQLALNGAESSFRSFYRTWNGVRRTDRVRLVPHVSEDGKVLGFYALLIDVTEQWQSEEKLREALDQAKSAARARDAFLATVSHELRTPLNAIIGFNSLMLEKDCSPEERRRYLSFARDAGQALLTQVNDLLDMAKIEAGKIELESVDFDLAQLIETSVNVIRSEAQLRGIDVGIEISTKLGRWVRGDPARLRQILLNLLNNALKFTEQGSIHVSARLVGERMMEISVADSGVGIPADRLEAIFEKFSQADVSITRRFGGTGLGLAICKSLAKLMGGEISVESEPDSGSIFRVTIPLHEAAPVTVAAPLRGARTGRILVVEDQEANSVLAKALLEDMGHQVELAANGSEALDRLLQERFDLVLMDLEMPVMGGLEATRHIRAMTNPARNIPVIAMSASVYADDIASCLAAGMVDHIAKPIGREVLIRALDHWLPERRMRSRNAITQPAAAAPLGKLIAMVGKDSAIQVAKAFEAALVKRLDLFRAERPDFPAIKIEAHNLAGISTTLGFDELAETARQVEDRIKRGEPVEELMPHLIARCEAAGHDLQSALAETVAG